jgi:transcriptional enhancer factor
MNHRLFDSSNLSNNSFSSTSSSTTSSSNSTNSFLSSLTSEMVVQLPGLAPGNPVAAFAAAGFPQNGLLSQNAATASSTAMDRLLMAASGNNAGTLLSNNSSILDIAQPPQSHSQPNSGEASPGSSHSNQDMSGDAEGVWSPDIDQAFHEALQIYPPCGRRKIILSDEGKMYGRNELIARYIKIRCGKTRTRKQVSSHIQVLARKRQRDHSTKMKGHDSTTSSKHEQIDEKNLLPFKLPTDPASILQNNGNNSSNSLWSYGNNNNNNNGNSNNSSNNNNNNGYPYNFNSSDSNENMLQQFAAAISSSNRLAAVSSQLNSQLLQQAQPPSSLLRPSPGLPHENGENEEHTMASSKLTLCGLEAYVQKPGDEKYIMLRIPKIADEPLEDIAFDAIRDKYPTILEDLMKNGPSDGFFLVKCWSNVDFEIGNLESMSYAVDSFYESKYNFDISVSTKVCSFGAQVVEKVEIYSPVEEQKDGSTIYHFSLEGSPMCEYMVRFIAELKKLVAHELMNSVLDNFTVLQIVTNKLTGETLMVCCFILEVSPDPDPTCRIYRVVQ